MMCIYYYTSQYRSTRFRTTQDVSELPCSDRCFIYQFHTCVVKKPTV